MILNLFALLFHTESLAAQGVCAGGCTCWRHREQRDACNEHKCRWGGQQERSQPVPAATYSPKKC